jgi:hypothetical protein
MPAAKVSLDLDTRRLSTTTGTTVQGLSGKRGSILDFQLAVTQAGLPVNLPIGSTIEVGMKVSTADPGDLILHADADATGWGTGSRWFFRLDLTTGFDAVVGKSVEFEVVINMPDGQRIASLTVPFNILRQVI